MKRITASFLVFSALSAPALISAPAMAETPVERSMHSWDYVQQVANPPAPQEAPVVDHREGRPYYHHNAEQHKNMHHHEHGSKHHHEHGTKKHEGTKKHAHHHHHHHHMDSKKDTTAPAKDQSKQ